MKHWKKQRKKDGALSLVQTRRWEGHPFTELNRYAPLTDGCARLYDALRESVPILDAAIYKIVRLVGGFHVETGQDGTDRLLDAFLQNVPVGGNQTGAESFLSTYLEQLLTYGSAVGEIVLRRDGRIAALYNSDLEGLELRRADNGLEVQVCRRKNAGISEPVPRPELVCFSVLNPSPGKMCGNSLLKGLPFVSEILLKIYHTIGLNWERVGNVRFSVNYKPKSEGMDQAFAQERAEQIAREWRNAMQSTGTVKDFVTVGDVDIKVIGADNQILDSQVPVRQMLEQIVAKTGIPPFLLGLNWSSTERMSSQQADVLTSELEAYRRILTPVITQICRLWLRLQGKKPALRVVWDDITLQDEVEVNKARLYQAQAQKLEQTEKEMEK